MLNHRLFLPVLAFCLACSGESSAPITGGTDTQDDFMRGADLSFLPEIEEAGAKFYDSEGAEVDALLLLRKYGGNTVRLRVWHTPSEAYSSLPAVVAMAARVKAAGMKVFLTVHYSDTWADPGHQQPPAAWSGLSLVDLQDSVYRYTVKVVTAVRPDYIQIGNEINGGMLWDQGSISNKASFLELIKAGCRAVRDTDPVARILLHYAGTDDADWFFDQVRAASVDYDLIGLSYYPLWHGFSLTALKESIDALIAENNKPLLIAETAYPFSLGYADYTNNIVGLASQLIPDYPATPQGQRDFLFAVRSIVEQNPKGAGFCYWGAEWIAFRGPTATNGSAGENLALFDFTNKALPAMDVFAR